MGFRVQGIGFRVKGLGFRGVALENDGYEPTLLPTDRHNQGFDP